MHEKHQLIYAQSAAMWYPHDQVELINPQYTLLAHIAGILDAPNVHIFSS